MQWVRMWWRIIVEYMATPVVEYQTSGAREAVYGSRINIVKYATMTPNRRIAPLRKMITVII